jgi:tripartite-type tricarboxylate transporter receptor subunit TctC
MKHPFHNEEPQLIEHLGRNFCKVLRWLPVMAIALFGTVHAQAWPTKPVRIVVPVSAGGTTDILARMVGAALSQNLGQQFVVDTKPGAAGAIGSLEVARAPADGYTLLLATSSSHAVAPAVARQLTYNPVDDFTPIALVAEANNLLLVAPNVEAKDVKELLALAKQKPGFLNYVSSGIGSFGHLTFALFASQANVQMTHVPYKGTAAAITDLVSGQVHLAADAIPSGLPHVKAGRLRGLAVTGPRRSPLAPEIPTIAESGLPGYAVTSWFGLYGPRGIPPQMAQRINEEVNKALHSPEITARFASMGIDAGKGSPADFATMVASDTARWSRLAKELKIQLD